MALLTSEGKDKDQLGLSTLCIEWDCPVKRQFGRSLCNSHCKFSETNSRKASHDSGVLKDKKLLLVKDLTPADKM